jgi:formylglycine-generating enzyme required for sulfatase activity
MPRLALSLLTAVLAAASHSAEAAPASEVACRGDGTRVALLIGNQDYVGTMQPLDNPRRDIAALGALLCQHGFTVFRHADLDVTSFDSTVETFARAAKGTKTALVYYSGHGFAVGRKNWLVPVDARLGCEDISADAVDVPPRLERRLIDLDKDVLSRLEGAGDQIVILDACRTDPVKGCRGGATPSLIKGLVRTSASSARLIVYATQDGHVALDRIRGSETSPLIAAMLKRLPENSRRDWVSAMGEVSREVFTLTDRKQRPNIDFSLPPQGCLALDCGLLPVVDPCNAAADHWRSAEIMASLAGFEDHLARFPTCAFAGLARAKIGELKTKTVVVVPPVPPATPSVPAQPAVVAPPLMPPSPSEMKPRPAVGVFPTPPRFAPLSSERERALKPKDTFKECDDCPEMVVVPAGSFTMGSPLDEPDREPDEGPQHRVSIARQFAVGKFAVTFDEWDACIVDGGCNGYWPSDEGWGRGKQPVINVSWDDAQAYIAWLSKKTGKTYRLLSEAEREYVTRAGTMTPFWWGSSISTSQANYDGASLYGSGSSKGEYRRKALPVDSFQPNPWGLFQVHGNVWEWTDDCYDYSYRGAPADGSALFNDGCSFRVLRGGAWDFNARDLRAASRIWFTSDHRYTRAGFRVARTAEQADAMAQRAEAPPPLQQAVVAPAIAPATPRSLVWPTFHLFQVKPLAAALESALRPRDTFKECDGCPEMVVVPAGSFTMGSPASEKNRSSEEGPQRRVTFARQFAVGRFAVTFDEWDACVADGGCNGYRPDDRGWGRGKQPAINVSWNDAKAYVAWLSRRTGKSYRLLSEAEREYVARAGTSTPFWWGSSISTSQGNYNGSYSYGGGKGDFREKTMPVDSFQPNPWGIYQVHGNVWEWTDDCGNDSYRAAPANGSAWTTGNCATRILRGGSLISNPASLRAAARIRFTAGLRDFSLGFRVARTLAP